MGGNSRRLLGACPMRPSRVSVMFYASSQAGSCASSPSAFGLRSARAGPQASGRPRDRTPPHGLRRPRHVPDLRRPQLCGVTCRYRVLETQRPRLFRGDGRRGHARPPSRHLPRPGGGRRRRAPRRRQGRQVRPVERPDREVLGRQPSPTVRFVGPRVPGPPPGLAWPRWECGGPGAPLTCSLGWWSRRPIDGGPGPPLLLPTRARRSLRPWPDPRRRP